MTDEYIDLTPKCDCGYAHNLEIATTCKQCGAPYPPASSKAGMAKARAARGAGGGPPVLPKRSNTATQRRHVFVAPAAEHTLQVGKVFTAGRNKDCTLTIPSQRVSRKHAEVFWRSGFPVLKNLSSGNPTKVNGRAIDEHELRDNDEVQVGPYQFVYRVLRPGQSAASSVDNQAQTMVAESEALAGSLSQLNLFEILAAFERQEKTGTISISTDSKDGAIILDKGKFVKANFENVTGEDAVIAMLNLEDGLFSFSKEQKAAPMKIMRKFDYSATGAGGGGRDLKRIKISQVLKRAKELQERKARGQERAARRPGGPERGQRRPPPRRGGGGGAHPGRGY